MYSLLKDGGKMICSDFHPFTKINDILNFEQPSMSYFSTDIFEGEMAHTRFLEKGYPRTNAKVQLQKIYGK